MTRVLHCADAGFECDKTIEGESDEDVMSKAAEHAREAHGMNEIDEATGQKIRSLIHEAH
jgi:predicted small metal-binding protein